MDSFFGEKKIEEVDNNVRIFLRYLEIIDKCMRQDKRKPILSTSYSYMCLIHISDVLIKYWYLINLWEGGFSAERITKKVKPLVHSFLNIGM